MSIRTAIARLLDPDMEARAKFWEEAAENAAQWRHRVQREREGFRRALRSIASLRTPNCAHIGKRMADIAEAALADEGSAA